MKKKQYKKTLSLDENISDVWSEVLLEQRSCLSAQTREDHEKGLMNHIKYKLGHKPSNKEVQEFMKPYLEQIEKDKAERALKKKGK